MLCLKVSQTASPDTENEQACSFSVSGEAVGETLDITNSTKFKISLEYSEMCHYVFGKACTWYLLGLHIATHGHTHSK